MTHDGQAEPPASVSELAQLAAALDAATDARIALREIAALRVALGSVERLHVERALAGGASLAAIGRDLGISRQGVHRRYGELATGFRVEREPRPRPAKERAADAGLVMTPEARLTLLHAVAEAEATGDAVIGSEHVLLALLRTETLRALEGVSLERSRSQISAASSGSGVFAQTGNRPAARVFLLAVAGEARKRGYDRITPQLLLLTALADPDSAAARTLRALGVDVERAVSEFEANSEPPNARNGQQEA